MNKYLQKVARIVKYSVNPWSAALPGQDINPNYALQTPNNKEQIEKSVSYGVLSSLECSPKRCIPPELKIVRYLKPQGAANFTKSALLSGT